jgi:hypothetical protein
MAEQKLPKFLKNQAKLRSSGAKLSRKISFLFNGIGFEGKTIAPYPAVCKITASEP